MLCQNYEIIFICRKDVEKMIAVVRQNATQKAGKNLRSGIGGIDISDFILSFDRTVPL